MEKEATVSEFQGMLEARGVSRRSFMKLCGTLAVAAGLSELVAPQIAQALEESVIGAKEGKLYPVIWIEGASCTGCTEAFAQIDQPDPAAVVLEMISLNYSETLSAAAGHSMEQAKKQTIDAGNYLLVYEGAVLERWNGNALRVAGKPGTDHLVEAAEKAKAVVALGSCAVNGGWMGANPNSAGAVGVQKYLQKAGIKTPVVNIPGCPANPEWLVAVLVDVVMLDRIPALTNENKPIAIFGETIHDNCQRRGHFENGEFVYKFGSKEEALGYCLYPMGCRGPQTKANCGIVRYNHRRSWCIESGAPCIGCVEAAPMDPGHNWVEVNTPFYKRHRDLRIGDFTFQPGTIALAVTGILAGCLIIHGFGMKATGRMDGGADFEKVRAWDAKHPDKSVGQYSEADMKEAEKKYHHDDQKGGQA
ncbi:MAG: hydrogenase small subunit [Raoultibacter sp.]